MERICKVCSMAGAVLNSLNIRLDAASLGFILEHGEAKILFVDRELSPVARAALDRLDTRPLVIDIDDALAEGGDLIGGIEYDAFLAEGEPEAPASEPADEWQSISLLYTSGTTGNPKGCVYSHRGAYLNAFGNMMTIGLGRDSVYLWTLPMFHCDGWTFTWGVTAACATHVCLRKVEPASIYRLIAEHGVTHMCGAPVVLSVLAHAPESAKAKFPQTVVIATGGAAEVPMKHGTSDEIAEKLSIEVVVGKENNTEGKLAIRFGPHTLTAPVTVYLTKSKAVEAGYEGEKKKKTKY